ncbi:MAG TPA: hypothetical protein VKV20_20270 [Ktedonobacteraceae bacterium]|jgi:hypothetical protein|nr:hypothetical protein [Ktedonobacteraceae bacterium]
MKPFDDSIPEEVAPQQQELLALLLHAFVQSAPLTSGEQEQLLARVRERLLSAPANLVEVSVADEEPLVEGNILPAQPSLPAMGKDTPGEIRPHPGRKGIDRRSASSAPGPYAPPPRNGNAGVFRLLNSLAAVLVLGALVGAAVLLFSHRPQSESGGDSGGSVLVAQSSAGGLELSLYLTPGPYFLSEMLAVDVSLTNNSNNPYYVGEPFMNSACGYSYNVNMTGGEAPYYKIMITTDHSCPYNSNAIELKPGQTLTSNKYLPLTASGDVTLTSYTDFYTKNATNSFPFYTSITGPFAGHWPSKPINVDSRIPSNLKLSYNMQGTHVNVNAPPAARSHLLYLYDIGCQDFNDSGSTGTGNYGWESITSNQVSLPGCPGKNPQWDFAFAAPGYAIVTGNYPPTANHR